MAEWLAQGLFTAETGDRFPVSVGGGLSIEHYIELIYFIPRLLPGGVDFNLGYTVFVMRYITLSLSYTSSNSFEESD